MPHAWKVIVRDKAGKVIPAPDGKEMKLLICGPAEEQPDGTVVRLPCMFQTEQEVCDHVRKHYRNFVPIGAYDADKDPPRICYPVPPASFQFGILDAVRALQGGGGAASDQRLLTRKLIPRALIQPRTHR